MRDEFPHDKTQKQEDTIDISSYSKIFSDIKEQKSNLEGYSYKRRTDEKRVLEDVYSKQEENKAETGNIYFSSLQSHTSPELKSDQTQGTSQEPIDLSDEKTKELDILRAGYTQRIDDKAVYAGVHGETGNIPEISSYSDSKKKTSASNENLKKSTHLEKKELKKRNRKKARRNRRVFRVTWIVMVVFVAIVLGEYLVVGVNDVFAVDRDTQGTAQIEIPENCTLEEVAEILQKGGVIANTQFFKLYCSVTNSETFRRGEYEMPTNMDYEGIINYLWSNSNRVDTVQIMFREGITVQELAELLEENEVCKAEDILSCAKSNDLDRYDFVKLIPSGERYYKLEGYLFPDTYEFYKGEEAEDVLSRMVYNCQNKFTSKMLRKIEESGRSVDEILTVASLIQAEASNESEMGIIGSILYNRLETGAEHDIWRLELDSTVYYPYKTIEDVPESLKSTFTSTYDTYSIQGLPEGAICNPGLAAIKAAIEPEETEYYYFCHDAEGNSYYARTHDGHLENMQEAGLLSE